MPLPPSLGPNLKDPHGLSTSAQASPGQGAVSRTSHKEGQRMEESEMLNVRKQSQTSKTYLSLTYNHVTFSL